MEFVLLFIVLGFAYLVWAKSSKDIGSIMNGQFQADQESIREQVREYLAKEAQGKSKREIFVHLAPSNLKAKHNVIKHFQVMVMNKEVLETENDTYVLNDRK